MQWNVIWTREITDDFEKHDYRPTNFQNICETRGNQDEKLLFRAKKKNYKETAKIEKNLGNRVWRDACWLRFGLWGYLVTTITSHHSKKSTWLVTVSLADSTEIVQESARGMTQVKGVRKCQWHPPRPQQNGRISTRNVHWPETRLWSHNTFRPGTLGTQSCSTGSHLQ